MLNSFLDIIVGIATLLVVGALAYFFGGWAIVGLQGLGASQGIVMLEKIPLGSAHYVRLGMVLVFIGLWSFYVFERYWVARKSESPRKVFRPFLLGLAFILAEIFGLYVLDFKLVRVSERGRAIEHVIRLSQWAEQYKALCGFEPRRLSDLVTGSSSCPEWLNHSQVVEIPRDPWGRDYLFVHRTDASGLVTDVEVRSLGRDGRIGGYGDDQDVSSLDVSGI